MIDKATQQRSALLQQQCALRQPATEAKCWYHEYIASQSFGVKSRHFWRYVELRQNERNPVVVEYRDHRGKWERLPIYQRWNTVEHAATIMNQKRVEALQGEIDQLDKYIARQAQRIAEWKPADLHPIS